MVRSSTPGLGAKDLDRSDVRYRTLRSFPDLCTPATASGRLRRSCHASGFDLPDRQLLFLQSPDTCPLPASPGRRGPDEVDSCQTEASVCNQPSTNNNELSPLASL